jgi:LysM repeat protein
MKNLWQVFQGIIIALASIGLVLGGFSLSLVEGNMNAALVPAHTLTPTYSPTLQPFTPVKGSTTPSPTPSLTSSPSLSPTLTPTLTTTPTHCPTPAGWTSYEVEPGDTLDNIAAHYRISSTELQKANCLQTTGLLPGVVIYVPPITIQTSVACSAPSYWIVYIVRPGDTLYRLSLAYGISVAELQRANCMGSSTLLQTGQILYVPPWASRTPSPTAPGVEIPTATLTNTPELSLPSDTPTEVPTNVPTETLPPAASDTPVEIPTETLTPTTP